MKNKFKLQFTVSNQNTEYDLKILLRILSIIIYKQFLPSYIIEITQCMSGKHLTKSEYALQQVVVLFGDLLFHLEEAHLTHTYQVVFRF